jgi:GTP-binding protein Era
MDQGATRAGFCAIIGAPNAGKSTLVNQLTGTKISIVSHKVQTTRARLRAIFVAGNTQVVLVDTPGIFQPKRKLDEAMVANAWAGAAEADCVLVLVDARSGLTDDVRSILAALPGKGNAQYLVINKVDLVDREKLLPLSEQINALVKFDGTYMISALSGSGIEKLKDTIVALMPEGPWLYPEDQLADANMRFLAAETTREKIYERLHQELPYASTVETEAWEEKPDGSVKISQVIYVERDGQKAIVLGQGGQTIKQLGQMARKDLEATLGRKVHLFLFVKVREHWTQDPERLRSMGLDV